jgi:menaquinone-dependent protoporphyrinogen oxidase
MKVLVAHASRHGSTAGIAAHLGAAIEARCAQHRVPVEVVVEPAATVRSLADVHAVVLGSAVYVGKWLPPARELVRAFTHELKSRDVWLFSSGPLGDPPRPVDEPAEPLALVGVLGAHEHKVLAGALDRGHLGHAERLVARAVHAPEGDFRDWDAIRDWGYQIADDLIRSARLTEAG